MSTERRSRRTLPLLLALAALAVLLAAPAASAATYIITLDNGTSFESRYQPEEAEWDSSVVMLLTQYGNWIALEKETIADVVTDIESQGFGKVIDTKTVSLGVLANDAVEPTDPSEMTQAQVLQQFLQQQQGQPQQDYTVQQFVDPSQAGTGGLPVGYSQQPSAPTTVLVGGQ